MSKPFIVSLEGNIGSGKSTLLNTLKKLHPEWTYVDEPVDSWMSIKNEDGENLLEVFYKDIKRWSYTFQNAAALTRSEIILKALKEWEDKYSELISKNLKGSKVIVMERSVETDKNVFAKMLKEDKMLDGIEWILYNKWYDFITNNIPKIDLFIWVNTSSDVCSERIKIRGRKEEEDISLEYLQNLEKNHTEWLENENNSLVFASVNIDEIIKKIQSFNI